MNDQQDAPTGTVTTINAVNIARLAGVRRAAVSNWRKRYDDFPAQIAGTASSPLFDADEIRAWLDKYGKLAELPLADELWRELDGLRGTTDTVEVLITFAVALRHLFDHHGRLAAELTTETFENDRALTEAVAARVSTTVGELDLDLEPLAPEPDWAPLLRLLDRAAEEPSAFEELLVSTAERAEPRGAGVVPPELARLMAGLADRDEVFDPYCGLGELLLPTLDSGVAAGQHPNRQLLRLATARMLLHTRTPPRPAAGDALREDGFPGQTFGAVRCVPPWNVKDWGFEELQFDPRWEYGLPPRGAAELAWVQHALAHLDTSGVAVLGLPAGVCGQARGRRIRAELVRRGVLRAVVALPSGALPGTSASTVLWVLRNAGAEPPGGVLLLDGSRLLKAKSPDWDALRELVLPAWREFDGAGTWPEEPGVCRVVPAIDLLDEEVDLSPARHLAGSVRTDVAGIRTAREHLLGLLRELPALVPEVLPEDAPARPHARIGELARTGAMTVLQQVPTGAREEDAAELTALTAQDVHAGRAPSGVLRGAAEPVRLREGDVVLPMLGERLVSRVIEREEAVLGPHLWLLRPNPEQLDSWFLAGFLRNSANAALGAGSGTARLDVRKVELPRVPPEEQRRWSDTFRGLFRLEHGLHRVREQGGKWVDDMIDGLTGNGLRPPRDEERG
ncbi:N-6 DNA methylase [Actinopolyspora sp. H202]|uniref:N-6 DNA methylase n=1 Tax=Actinopolyspora sp. H202 TaxID=1500456 RepID=UPI003EE6EF03